MTRVRLGSLTWPVGERGTLQTLSLADLASEAPFASITALLQHSPGKWLVEVSFAPAAGSRITLVSPEWPGMTDVQRQFIKNYMNLVYLHETGHQNLDARLRKAYRAVFRIDAQNAADAVTNAQTQAFAQGQLSSLQAASGSVNHLYDSVTQNGEKQSTLGGVDVPSVASLCGHAFMISNSAHMYVRVNPSRCSFADNEQTVYPNDLGPGSYSETTMVSSHLTSNPSSHCDLASINTTNYQGTPPVSGENQTVAGDRLDSVVNGCGEVIGSAARSGTFRTTPLTSARPADCSCPEPGSGTCGGDTYESALSLAQVRYTYLSPTGQAAEGVTSILRIDGQARCNTQWGYTLPDHSDHPAPPIPDRPVATSDITFRFATDGPGSVTVSLAGRWPDLNIDRTDIFFGVVEPGPRYGWFYDKTSFMGSHSYTFGEAGLYEFDMLCKTALGDHFAPSDFSDESDGVLDYQVRVNS
jgi:hypothetical protein